jgi:heptaprenyl diphosphate synthase
MTPTRRLTILGALLAMALVLAIVETMLGALIPVPIPGVKLGLANIISMFILCAFSLGAALTVAILRTFLAALMTGGLSTFFFSAPGAVVSILVMYVVMRTARRLTLVGVSMLGAAVHNIMQVSVAVLATGEINLFYYAFVLLIVGAVSGTITGIVARMTFGKAAHALHMPCKCGANYQIIHGGMS